MACSGLHRELQFKVKSVSMASFSAQEVANLQRQGNGIAMQTWLARWDQRDYPLPDGKDRKRTKTFIAETFVRKRWIGQPTGQQAQAPQAPTHAMEFAAQSQQAPAHDFFHAAPAAPPAATGGLAAFAAPPAAPAAPPAATDGFAAFAAPPAAAVPAAPPAATDGFAGFAAPPAAAAPAAPPAAPANDFFHAAPPTAPAAAPAATKFYKQQYHVLH